MVRGHHTVINMQVLTCKHSLPHLGNSHSRWITHLYTKCLFLLCSVFFFSTSILLASITSLSARGLCTDPISPHNSVAFIPCCTSFTTDSVLLGICFYTACLLCPFMRLWAGKKYMVYCTSEAAFKVVLTISSGIISSRPKSTYICLLPSLARVHTEYSALLYC